MNKTDLVSAVAATTGCSKKDAALILEAAINKITESLVNGEKVQLSGFGTFETRQREARIGRNPHTREAISIPATKVPSFKASKALKERVSEQTNAVG